MYELLQQGAGGKQQANADATDRVGRTSATADLAPQAPDEHDQAQAQGGPPSTAAAVIPKADEAAGPGPDNPDAKERIYGDQHHHAHHTPFERHQAHAEKHHPKYDKFNKAGIHSDKMTSHVAARPGAVVTEHGHTNGVFMLKNAHATRYIFVKHGNHNVAQPFDVVDRADLAHGNYKAHHKKHDSQGRTKRLLLNASMPRELMIDGKPHMCVLSWVDGMTAAWIKATDLEGNTQHLLHAVKARATRWDPGRVANDPHQLAKLSTHYVVRNDAVGESTHADRGKNDKHPRVLDAGAKGGDNVEHYLTKDIRKPGFDAEGNEIGKNVTRSIVALCMNLPEPHTPPLAIDTLTAGQSFFAMKDKSFHRSVPVFANGAHHASILQTWVFGNVGMRDANGKLVPDPSRRGWLPLRTLAEAAHLETHDIEQRKP